MNDTYVIKEPFDFDKALLRLEELSENEIFMLIFDIGEYLQSKSLTYISDSEITALSKLALSETLSLANQNHLSFLLMEFAFNKLRTSREIIQAASALASRAPVEGQIRHIAEVCIKLALQNILMRIEIDERRIIRKDDEIEILNSILNEPNRFEGSLNDYPIIISNE